MKRVALAFALAVGAGSEVLAADLAVSPPLYAPPVAYNWTGFYIGGNLGGGLSASSFSDPLGNVFAESNGGGTFLGGGQVGINYQFWGGVVIGAEADFDWLPNTNTAVSTLANPPGMITGSTATLTINNRWLTSVTGRVGYAFDRVLFTAKVAVSGSDRTIRQLLLMARQSRLPRATAIGAGPEGSVSSGLSGAIGPRGSSTISLV